MILVDTDVLIDIMNEKVDIPDEPLAITTITLYEFLRGAKDIDVATNILEDNFVILGESEESIKISAKIWQDLRKKGKTLHDADIIIAGIAIAHKVPIWTRNHKHYKRLMRYGLKLYGQDKS